MTPDPTLIEQVARALFEHAERRAIETDAELAADPSMWLTWDTANEPVRAPYREQANVVLATLQGSAALPSEAITPEMIEAGNEAKSIWQQSLDPRTHTLVEAIYIAMRATTPTAPDLAKIDGDTIAQQTHVSRNSRKIGERT